MYEILSHTADVGLVAEAPDLAGLFSEAARAVAAIVLDADPPEPGADSEPVDVSADDLAGLLVELLQECLYLYEVRGALVVGARLSVTEAPPRASGQLLTAAGLAPAGPMVKAVTYHQLRVERAGDRWRAEVYLDV